MLEQDQVAALAELDGWKQHPSQENTYCLYHGTQLKKEAHWQAPVLQRYLTSYDAIIPLIQKQPLAIRDRIATKGGPISFMATPAQLAEKLLRATGKWKE